MMSNDLATQIGTCGWLWRGVAAGWTVTTCAATVGASVGNGDGESAGEGVRDGETVLAHAEISRAIKTAQLW